MKEYNDLISIFKRAFRVRTLLWVIYLSLLAVLLPHTAWWFTRSQSPDSEYLAWPLAFVFEASIFGFTHNLVALIETSRRMRQREGERWYSYNWRKFSKVYLNLNGFGLLVCSLVSGLANFTYSVEFSGTFKLFDHYSVPHVVYHLASGGILPMISLLFAHILAQHEPGEDVPNESEQAAKAAERAAKKEVSDLRSEVDRLRGELDKSRSEVGKLQLLFSEDKRVRIITARELFPEASGSALAQITKTSPPYVSEVLGGLNGHNK